MSEAPETGGPRRLSAWLLLGMLVAPVLFCWFLLWPGYSPRLRTAGFAYAAIFFLLGLTRFGHLA